MGWRHRLGTNSFSMTFETVRAGHVGQDCVYNEESYEQKSEKLAFSGWMEEQEPQGN